MADVKGRHHLDKDDAGLHQVYVGRWKMSEVMAIYTSRIWQL